MANELSIKDIGYKGFNFLKSKVTKLINKPFSKLSSIVDSAYSIIIKNINKQEIVKPIEYDRQTQEAIKSIINKMDMQDEQLAIQLSVASGEPNMVFENTKDLLDYVKLFLLEVYPNWDEAFIDNLPIEGLIWILSSYNETQLGSQLYE